MTSGSIIVRQRGMTFLAGSGTGLGHDYTVFATVDGHVRFEHATRNKKRIRVLPVEVAAAAAPTAKPAAPRTAKPAAAKSPAKPRARAAKTDGAAGAATNATA